MRFKKTFYIAKTVLALLLVAGMSTSARSATIHAVLVGDVHDANIGPGDKLDLGLIKGLLNDVVKNTGMKLNLKMIDDRIDRSTVMRTVSGLRPASDDMVLFYYTGHGYRMRSMKKEWPAMALNGPNNDTAGLDQFWVFSELKRKNPRFLMVMTDACNNYVDEGAVDTKLFVQTGREKKESYKKLFADYRGAIIASSSRPGQYSYSGSKGSQFTVAFLRNLRQALGSDNPQWEKIMKSSTSPLMNGQQNPQFAIMKHDGSKSDSAAESVSDDTERPPAQEERASGERVAGIGGSILQLESNVKSSSFDTGWSNARTKWVAEVRDAGNDAGRLRDSILNFEANIKYSAQIPNWPQKRARWIESINGADSVADVAKSLIEVEQSLARNALDGSWVTARSGWARQVESFRGGRADDGNGSDESTSADMASDDSFGDLLIELESNIEYSAQSQEWPGLRDSWMSAVRRAGGRVAALKEQVIVFERNLLPESYRGGRRPGVAQNARSASSIAELKRVLVGIESSLDSSSKSGEWSGRRQEWLNRMR